MLKNLLSAIFLCVLVLLLVACNSDTNDVGEYENAGEQGSEETVGIPEDGIVQVDKDSIPLEDGFVFVDEFSEGLICVASIWDGSWDNRKYGFVDEKGKVVVPLEYDFRGDFNYYRFQEGLARVEKDRKYGFVDKTGRVVIPLEFDYVRNGFSDGLACVGKYGKSGYIMGYINKTGQVVVPLEYDYVWDFSDGLACVYKNDKCGFVDKTGQLVVPLEYDYNNGFYFSDGLASVTKDGKTGVIDKTGQVVVPFE
jgi:hypothetical protein